MSSMVSPMMSPMMSPEEEGAWAYPHEVRCWVGGLGWFNYDNYKRDRQELTIYFEKYSRHAMDTLEIEYIFADELLFSDTISADIQANQLIRLHYKLVRH